jgi:hypothetical protein
MKVNIPAVVQIGGAVLFGVAVWKGVHGAVTSAALIVGAGALYVGNAWHKIFG